ncbi:hypothetical protein GCM10027570_45240 [Streptomonospora sediminis]
MLLFTGTGGSGKSSLLRKLAAEVDQVVPYAEVDFDQVDRSTDLDLPEVLSDLAYELGRKCPGYGRLRFHRLVVGRLAMNEETDFTDPEAFRRRMSAVLRQHRGYDKVWEATRVAAGELAGQAVAAPLDAPVSALASLGVDQIALGQFGNRFLLGEPYRWYGHRDQGLTNDPMDALADLNRRSRNFSDADNRRRVSELLMEAFVADLRAAFNRGNRARPGMYDCVLLLDNIDGEAGRRFLDQYLSTCRRSAVHGHPADPMVIAATSRPAERFTRENHLRDIPLRDLTCDETEALARPDLPGEVDHRVPRLIHQLTGGHPGTTALLLHTVALWPSAAQGGIPSLLVQEEPGSIAEGSDVPTGISVEERLREDLLLGLPGIPETAPLDDDLLAALAVFATARTTEDAAWLIAERLHSALLSPETLWRSCLWAHGAQTGDHSLLRWLLLRWSLRRDGNLVPELHRDLSKRCRTTGDTTGELYHALGAGDFAGVARSLTERLDRRAPRDGDGPPWVELLTEVTSVPHISDDAGDTAEQAPHRLQTDLAATAGADGGTEEHAAAQRHLPVVARIAAGLWIAADPRTSPDRYFLHTQIATDFRGLAAHSNQPVDLFQEARRHGGLAHDWT